MKKPVGALLLFASAFAHAQYPQRPVTLIVPWGAGGVTDATARIIGVLLMLGFGIVGYLMEENGFPVAPAILGMVLGAMLKENFISSMVKADGRLLAFFERPIAGALGALTVIVLLVPLLRRRVPAA